MDRFFDAAMSYLCIEKHPSVKGLADSLGISRMTLSNYKGRSKRWKDLIEDILGLIKQVECEV